MTDREKLLRLIGEAQDGGYDVTDVVEMNYTTNEYLADHLLANGVTISDCIHDCKNCWKTQLCNPKWIPVTERLPDLIPCKAGTAYSEAVIVWTDGRKAMIAVWDGIDFLCAADYWEAWGETITHWMPLPEPPKGDSI